MKILVTGGAGYVGSVCTQVLLEAGHDVTVIDDFSTGNRDVLDPAVEVVTGDIATEAEPVLARGGFEAVIHCAARSLVGESVADPAAYWQHNVISTFALLEAMRAHGVPSLVFSSTAATYGEPAAWPITEDFPTAPTNPYGASKLAIDHMITSYAHAYGLAATSLRYFNVAGAYGLIGENRRVETHLIPLVLQVALGHRDHIFIFGDDWNTPDGTCIRDYIHIKDLADAHLLALAANRPGHHRIFNLGSGTGYSVAEVIAMCRKVTGHPIPAQVSGRRPGDPAVLVASSEKISQELGWQPAHTDLETIVRDAWTFSSQLGSRAHSAPSQPDQSS